LSYLGGGRDATLLVGEYNSGVDRQVRQIVAGLGADVEWEGDAELLGLVTELEKERVLREVGCGRGRFGSGG